MGKIRRKEIIKEIESKTPGYYKTDDEPIVKEIKDFFKKNKKAELITIQIVDSQLMIDLAVEYKSDEENLAFRKFDARQEIYDLKIELEKQLQKKYIILPLTVQGINTGKEIAKTQFSTMLSNNTRDNIELLVD